jgi:hypothetical protein
LFLEVKNERKQMKRFSALCLVVVYCIAILSASVWAISPSEKQQLGNFKVSTLKGLRGVAVKIMIVRDGPETLPFLKEAGLQKDVEFALQSAGLEIASPTPEVGLYVVLVKVTAATNDNLNFAMHVQSSLLQIVNLSRDTTIKTEAQTWPSFGQGRFGVVSVAIAKTAIEKAVKEQAKDFTDDWKTANPKN